MTALKPFLNSIVYGDCIPVMKQMPNESIDLVLTDPPFIVDYQARDGRTIAGDRDGGWLEPAFAHVYRLLKPNSFCVSCYGWNQADRFVAAWKKFGLIPVSHLVFTKDYASTKGYTQAYHESAYVLAKGQPPKPACPIRDVLSREYTGNKYHPHEKPVPLMEALIVAFSKPGAIVLDPFAGSGTTGIAARRCGRRFILIEKFPQYYSAALRRLNLA